MHIEDTLAAILEEIRGVRADINRPIRADAVIAGAQAIAVANPQPPVAPVPPPAPSTVAVTLPPIAPVVPTVSSPEPTSAFAQAAVPSAAPATPAAPPTASPAATVDSKGMPWDGRIHASSKAQVADGSWRMKRGVDYALVKQVESELRAAQAAPAAPMVPAFGPHPFGDGAQAPVAAPVVPPPPPPASAYAALMARLSHHMGVGDIKLDQVTNACVAVGVPNVAALATREDLVPFVAQSLGIAL